MKFKDYYSTMGLERTATQDEIKRAYRKLARKYHPDVSKESDAEIRFKEVGEAYEVLKDPEKRAAYDQLGANWQSEQDFNPPPDWSQGFEFHNSSSRGPRADQFSDFFEALFGQRGYNTTSGQRNAYSSHSRGEDTHAKILINLEDSYQGSQQTLTLKHTELSPEGRPQLKERIVNVAIPKGVRQGQHIRLAKMGAPGIGQGEAGDLFLEVEFRPHPLFKIEGKDVYLKLPLQMDRSS